MTIRDLREFSRDTLRLLGDVAAEGTDVTPFRIGPLPAVVVTGPRPVREALVERPGDFDKGRRQLRALRPVLGYGLLTSDGELHARQRRMVQPTLVPGQVAGFIDTIGEEARRAIAQWPRTEPLDLMPSLNALAMDIVGRIIFGVPMRDHTDLSQAIQQAFEWEMKALTRLASPPAWLPIPGNRRMRKARSLVDARLAQFLAAEQSADPFVGSGLLRRLSLARDEDGLRMTKAQLFDEVRTLWGAAHETSADAQVWCLHLVARHPDVLRRLQSEADDVLGRGPLTDADLHRMPFALQTFKEAMRLYPPAAVILRAARRSTQLGGRHLRAGTLVFIVPYLMHRRSDIFERPEQFDPDRFRPGREQQLPKSAYLPFGAGKRVCVGGHLALVEGQILTATIAQHLDLSPVDDGPVEPELLINLRPSRPIRLRITDRVQGAVSEVAAGRAADHGG